MVDYSLRKPLTSFGRNILLILLPIEIALAALHVTTNQPDVVPFWTRLFTLDNEFGLSSTWNSTQLLAISLFALVVALRADYARSWKNAFWWFIAVLFAYLTLDEYLVIHETYIAPFVGPVIHWPRLFALIGVVLTIAFAAVWWFGFRDEPAVFVLLLGGLAVAASGGLGVESLNYFYLCVPSGADWELCGELNYVEETLEMVGVTIALAGVASYAHVRLNAANWRLAKRVFGSGCALWAASIISVVWALPTVEARLLAQPAEVEYADGALSLVGYRLSENVLAPGDEVTITLYWKANERLQRDYFVSAHLLTRPGGTSIAQGDRPFGGWLGWRAETWIPGIIMRDRLTVQLPAHMDTPRSYWLITRVWWPDKIHRKGDHIRLNQINQVLITQTDRQLLTEDTLVLESLPVIAEGTAPEPPPTEANYRFDGGFMLSGYFLPTTVQSGEPLTLEFWWQTEADVDLELVQFIHLRPSNSDETYAYDQPPFSGTFPTSDWPAGVIARDVRRVDLGDDFPPGEYNIFTGMYSPETGERCPVTGGDGQPIQDDAILLGTLTIE